MNLKEGYPPKDSMKLGYGKKPNTKAWKVLKFIKSKGEEGASLKEIQHYIYFVLNDAPLGQEYFEEKDGKWGVLPDGKWKRLPGKGSRKSRGYWGTELYSTGSLGGYKGLLPAYCKKNPKNNKWVFDKYPEAGENIYRYNA